MMNGQNSLVETAQMVNRVKYPSGEWYVFITRSIYTLEFYAEIEMNELCYE